MSGKVRLPSQQELAIFEPDPDEAPSCRVSIGHGIEVGDLRRILAAARLARELVARLKKPNKFPCGCVSHNGYPCEGCSRTLDLLATVEDEGLEG